jgi:hypothetical protein
MLTVFRLQIAAISSPFASVSEINGDFMNGMRRNNIDDRDIIGLLGSMMFGGKRLWHRRP